MEIKKVFICGITANNYNLFLSLEKHLSDNGIECTFVEPEITGQAKLIDNNIRYHKFSPSRCKVPSYIDSIIGYEILKLELETYIYTKIKKRFIKKRSSDLWCGYNILFKGFPDSLVIIWGGHDLNTAIPAYMAKKNNNPIIFIEKGSFSKTLQVSTEGVNYSNSALKKLSTLQSSKSKDLLFFKDIINQKWVHKNPNKSTSLNAKIKAYFQKKYFINSILLKLVDFYYLKVIKRNNDNEIWNLTGNGEYSDIKLPSRYIFFPLQVIDDSQVLINSNWPLNTKDTLVSISEIISEIDSEIKIVVKEHPSEFRKIDYSSFDKIDNILFLNCSTMRLITNSLFIITFNSTVGIEAIVQEKPVLTLGNAFYENLECVFHVNEYSEIKDTILHLINYNSSNNKAKSLDFLNNLWEELVQIDFTNPTDEESKMLWLKIINKLGYN